MNKKIYSLLVDCSQTRYNLSTLSFSRKKQKVKILNGQIVPAILMPPGAASYAGDLSITLVNTKNETIIENLSREFLSVPTGSSVRPIDILEVTQFFDELDTERSYIYIDTPVPNSYTVFYFIVEG